MRSRWVFFSQKKMCNTKRFFGQSGYSFFLSFYFVLAFYIPLILFSHFESFCSYFETFSHSKKLVEPWRIVGHLGPWLLIKQIVRLKWITLMMICMILCKFFCIQFAENESVLLGARNALPCLADIWILRQVISKHKMSRSTLKVMFICEGLSIKSKSGLQKMQKET